MSALDSRNGEGGRLARLLANLRERWWIVLASVIVLGGLAFVISLLLESRYSATAQLEQDRYNTKAISKALEDAGTAGLPEDSIPSDALTLQTSAFAERVSEALGASLSADELRASISTASDSEAPVIYVTATGSEADLVATVANAFAEEFVKYRQEEVQRLLQSALALVQERIRDSGSSLELEERSDAIDLLLSSQVADYEVLERATAPASPYWPKPILNLVWGLVAGLVLGLVAAISLGALDRRIKDQATLERVMDLPVLGAMPAPSRPRGATGSLGKNATVGFRKGNELLLESMRMLRSNLKVLGFGDTRRSVLVTSTAPGEGKSTLAVNLALSMALAGDRVILVDADLRNPSIDRYLSIPNTHGLAEALTDRSVGWSERIQAVDLAPFVDQRLITAKRPTDSETTVSKFLCLPSGALPGSPTEVLESPAMGDLLAELQGISDYVILDGPPMLMASDSLVLAQLVDAVILASALGRETVTEAKQVRQLLARAEIQALGLVICGGKPQPHDSYYYRPGRERSTSARRG